ncbi:hypothetical protein CH063_15508, partial [Colletotrichum higginsianum]
GSPTNYNHHHHHHLGPLPCCYRSTYRPPRTRAWRTLRLSLARPLSIFQVPSLPRVALPTSLSMSS